MKFWCYWNIFQSFLDFYTTWRWNGEGGPMSYLYTTRGSPHHFKDTLTRVKPKLDLTFWWAVIWQKKKKPLILVFRMLTRGRSSFHLRGPKKTVFDDLFGLFWGEKHRKTSKLARNCVKTTKLEKLCRIHLQTWNETFRHSWISVDFYIKKKNK